MRARILVSLLIAFAACQAPSRNGDGDDVGTIHLAVVAGPPDAACLRVTVNGGPNGPVVRTISLTPGAATMVTLAGLPVGQVAINAEAFSTICSAVTASSVATWVSGSVTAVLTPGTPVPIQLVMRAAGQISISVDWNTGAGGAGGTGGSGGTMVGTGGSTAGAGGSTGGTGAGGGGGLLNVASALDGQMLLMPCKADTQAAVCSTIVGACPNTNITDIALRGVLMTDKTITLGGTPGTNYSITLHIQGEVEAKAYSGAVDSESMLTSPAANGFAVGGTPNTSNNYGVYMLRVTNPDMTKTDYFLNSLIPPGVSNHTTYGVDYTATIQAQGGATVRIVAADSNCSQIKNCGPTQNDGSVCMAPIVLTNVEPTAIAANPGFSFTSAFNGQWLVMTLKSVTSP